MQFGDPANVVLTSEQEGQRMEGCTAADCLVRVATLNGSLTSFRLHL